jgi:hypothetical protein
LGSVVELRLGCQRTAWMPVRLGGGFCLYFHYSRTEASCNLYVADLLLLRRYCLTVFGLTEFGDGILKVLTEVVGYLYHIGFSEIPFLEGNYPQVSKKSIDVGVETSYFA